MDNIAVLFRKNKKIRITDFLYEHCNTTRKSMSYILFYRRLARLIEGFEQHIHKDMFSNSFDEKTTEEFFHYIKSSTPLKRGHVAYKQSTVRNFKLKTIATLHKLERQGYSVKTEELKSYQISNEEPCTVYLTEEEIEKLNKLNLNKTQAQVRDLFVIVCCTALRYSEYSRLSELNFKNGNISVLTQKTKTRVIIPIHRYVHEIIKRNNNDYSFLSYKDSQQNFNCMIKRICKKAGICDDVLVEQTEGFKKVRRKYKKWQLISSHTARRSGATNMCLAGIPVFRIMLITGHKTQAAFFLYIRIQREENANTLKDHPFFS